MPDWTPPPDVVFDHLRARQLIEDASRITANLHAAANAEAEAFARARRAWVGRVRAETDELAVDHQVALELAIQLLRQLVASMDAALTQAGREQARRDGLQDRWDTARHAERTAETTAEPIAERGGEGVR